MQSKKPKLFVSQKINFNLILILSEIDKLCFVNE